MRGFGKLARADHFQREPKTANSCHSFYSHWSQTVPQIAAAQNRVFQPTIVLSLSDSRLLFQQCERVIGSYHRRASVLTGPIDLDQQINGSPDRIQQTREREVEEAQHEILRGRGGHEPLDTLVAALNLPSVGVLTEKLPVVIRHEHRILSIIVILRVILLGSQFSVLTQVVHPTLVGDVFG